MFSDLSHTGEQLHPSDYLWYIGLAIWLMEYMWGEKFFFFLKKASKEKSKCEHIKNIKADVGWLLKTALDVGSCSGPATPAPQ